MNSNSFNVENLKPDTDQERRFLKKLFKSFSHTKEETKVQSNQLCNKILNGLSEECENKGIKLPKSDIEKSYNHLISFEKENGVRLPVVSLFEQMLSDPDSQNEIRHFKDFYFSAKQKYIELEESEDINNF
jgi:hypothetical protein